MDALSKLFGSAARLKLLRLFLFNPSEIFTLADAARRAKTSPEETRTEIIRLSSIQLLRRVGGKKSPGYRVNAHFEHLVPLEAFIRTTTGVRPHALLAAVKKAGAPQLVALSGFFTGASEAPMDLLVVGDRLDERALSRAVAALEAELGREIRYASFSTEDFRYRLGIYDRLIRDVLDYPHRLLVDKIGL